MAEISVTSLSPREIVEDLNKHIIGQEEAKRAVAIALRDRWRRMQIVTENPDLGREITPKNMLMVGPTGVGKTEISRRIARLTDAPFIKVEATKFTEVGFVGSDVEKIIRDLVDVAMKRAKEIAIEEVQHLAADAAEERILDILLPQSGPSGSDEETSEQESGEEGEDSADSTRQMFRKRLREGKLDDKFVEIETSSAPIGVEIMGPPGLEEMTSQLQNLFQNFGSDRKRDKKMTVKEALRVLQDEEANKLLNEEEIKERAISNVEQNGIVFIDEIDKVCRRSDHSSGADVSREGVQRDLLPLIEGCTVSTRYGMIKTDHILFIASGAFHLTKPSDLIPELQGRLPIRVELNALSADDFKRILVEPDASLTEQYIALLATENLELKFDDSAIETLAHIAWQVNDKTENIGARRLHTVMERLLNEISFEAPEKSGDQVIIDADYVNQQLKQIVKDEDLSHFIL